MKYRKLRIAWSVAWGVVAFLIVALWVRSYQRPQLWNPWGHHSIIADRGTILIDETWVRYRYARANLAIESHDDVVSSNRPNYAVRLASAGASLHCWVPTVVATALTVAPWMFGHGWRFSLRTVLIATTLAAVLLGLIVWAIAELVT